MKGFFKKRPPITLAGMCVKLMQDRKFWLVHVSDEGITKIREFPSDFRPNWWRSDHEQVLQ